MNTTLTESEVATIQRHLRAAISALDNQMPDLAEEVKVVFKKVGNRVHGTPAYTPDVTPAPWYDNHANLYKLAEWIRQQHGWSWFERNAIELLENPWKYEDEWRLASGSVEFKLVERPRGHEDDPLPVEFTVDSTRCLWCDSPVGYFSFEYEDGGREADWTPAYIDIKTNDLACDECASTAANFKDTVQS